MIKRPIKNRPGIAVIIAVIFMMAFLYTSMTALEWATRGSKESGDVDKSRQALYNAEHAVNRALYLLKNPERLRNEGYSFSLPKESIIHQTTKEKIGEFRILGISDPQADAKNPQALSSKIEFINLNGDKFWNVYPFPGTGNAGRNCDVYGAITKNKNVQSLYQKYGDGVFHKLGGQDASAADYSCNWNKIRSFDSAVEIPLYGVDDQGHKIWLKFDQILIRVRTACDESQFKTREGGTRASTTENDERRLYEETGMCRKDKRFEMYVDKDGYDFVFEQYKTGEETLKHTVLNWGIYSEKGGYNWLIPIKNAYKDKPDPNTSASNIHTQAINAAKENLQGSEPDFVVLDGDTKAQPGYLAKGQYKSILDVLNQSTKDNQNLPQLQNPVLRFTVENKFYASTSNLNEPPEDIHYIPHLEYQILYKISEGTIIKSDGTEPITNPENLQIIGLPTIIGEGYAGGFKHTLKAWIIQTKTGFDYVYQNQ